MCVLLGLWVDGGVVLLFWVHWRTHSLVWVYLWAWRWLCWDGFSHKSEVSGGLRAVACFILQEGSQSMLSEGLGGVRNMRRVDHCHVATGQLPGEPWCMGWGNGFRLLKDQEQGGRERETLGPFCSEFLLRHLSELYTLLRGAEIRAVYGRRWEESHLISSSQGPRGNLPTLLRWGMGHMFVARSDEWVWGPEMPSDGGFSLPLEEWFTSWDGWSWPEMEPLWLGSSTKEGRLCNRLTQWTVNWLVVRHLPSFPDYPIPNPFFPLLCERDIATTHILPRWLKRPVDLSHHFLITLQSLLPSSYIFH